MNLHDTSKRIIRAKYFESFNFYFSKPLNEILVNVMTSHAILYKDCIFYDEINEFMKRPYGPEESVPRIQ